MGGQVYFFPIDRHFLRRHDAQTDLVAADLDYLDGDVVADHDFLATPTRKYKHFLPSLAGTRELKPIPCARRPIPLGVSPFTRGYWTRRAISPVFEPLPFLGLLPGLAHP